MRKEGFRREPDHHENFQAARDLLVMNGTRAIV
jgi:hypothetical protein